MMRLPARLSAKLAKIRVAQIFNPATAHPLMQFVDPAEVLHPGADAPVSRERMQGVLKNAAPVVWIGGSEPLLHAGIGHFARAIGQSGHFVFLETDGALLRRRIHEFQPAPHLFLAVHIDSLLEGESALAIEGLRAARLSGFFTVIHSLAREGSDVAQFGALREFIGQKDVDGWLITAESSDGAAARKAAEARRLIPSSFWRQFSAHLEEVLLAKKQSRESHDAQALVPERLRAKADEEGVRIA